MAIDQEKVFAQAPMPETIDRTLDALAERYDIALPMGDLYSAPAKALLSDTTTGGYVGTENVGDTACYHLAFRDTGVDWELWLPVEGEPLPKRFKIVQTKPHRPAGDRRDLHGWNLAPQITDATFAPSVPADYEGIAILQRAAAVKATADAGRGPAGQEMIRSSPMRSPQTRHDDSPPRVVGALVASIGVVQPCRRRCAATGAAQSPRATTAPWRPDRAAPRSRARTATPRRAAVARSSAAKKATPRSAGTATS